VVREDADDSAVRVNLENFGFDDELFGFEE
jgi:hypothetical protein